MDRPMTQKETIKRLVEAQHLEDYLKIYYIIMNNIFKLNIIKYPKGVKGLIDFINKFVKENKIGFDIVFNNLYKKVKSLPSNKALLDIYNMAHQGIGMIVLMYYQQGEK